MTKIRTFVSRKKASLFFSVPGKLPHFPAESLFIGLISQKIWRCEQKKVQINDTENIFLQKILKWTGHLTEHTRQSSVSSMYQLSEQNIREEKLNVTRNTNYITDHNPFPNIWCQSTMYRHRLSVMTQLRLLVLESVSDLNLELDKINK